MPTTNTDFINHYAQPMQGQEMMGQYQPLKREKKMLGKVKEYIDEHKNIIFTIGLIILVDHFLFKGALRERIKTSIEGVLKKVEDKFHKEA